MFQEKGERWKHTGKDELNDVPKTSRDSNNRRKDRKNRRNGKDNKNELEVITEFKILKADLPEDGLPKSESNVLQPKFFDKPKEEKVKKFSESRRERRAMRNQAAKDKGAEISEGITQDDKPQVKNEQEGVKSGRDRKHVIPEQNRGKDERRPSLDSNGGGDTQLDSTSTRAERDVARIRKKVIITYFIIPKTKLTNLLQFLGSSFLANLPTRSPTQF